MSPTWPTLPRFYSQNQQHPPPPSSVYTDQTPHSSHSAALRPLSGLFQRITPRLSQHRSPPPAPRQPRQPWHPLDPFNTPRPDNEIHEAGAGQRSSAGSIIDIGMPPSPAAPRFMNNERPTTQLPEPAFMPEHNITRSGGAIEPDSMPIEFNASEIAQPDRERMRRHRRKHQHGHRPRVRTTNSGKAGAYLKRSAWRDSEVRVKLLHTVIAGMLFGITLIIFLALDPTTPVFSPSFRIVNSLLIIFFAIIFLHSAIRLASLLRAAKRRQRRLARKNAIADGTTASAATRLGGIPRAPYFDDPEIGLPPPGGLPFRVVLARDEELGLTDDVVRGQQVVEDEHVAGEGGAGGVVGNGDGRPKPNAVGGRSPVPPPPVYGVWRGSVRADPNLLHWQRVQPASQGRRGSEEMEEVGTRPPPSYRTEEHTRTRGHGNGTEEMLPSTRYGF